MSRLIHNMRIMQENLPLYEDEQKFIDELDDLVDETLRHMTDPFEKAVSAADKKEAAKEKKRREKLKKQFKKSANKSDKKKLFWVCQAAWTPRSQRP